MSIDKIFLDCGSHHLEGLRTCLDKKIIDESFIIHTFEANPECRVKERLSKFPYKNLNCTIHETAVWIEDGYTLFNQENHTKTRSRSPTDGTSLIDGWGSSVYGIGNRHLGYSHPIKVPCIDFSRFVLSLPSDAYIICKMDIEGSEFQVLNKMLIDSSISRIQQLFIEFHDRLMKNKKEEKEKLIKDIINSGTQIMGDLILNKYSY